MKLRVIFYSIVYCFRKGSRLSVDNESKIGKMKRGLFSILYSIVYC